MLQMWLSVSLGGKDIDRLASMLYNGILERTVPSLW